MNMRRQFKAWEICAFYADQIMDDSDPLAKLWEILDRQEPDRFERHSLFVCVMQTAYEFYGDDMTKLLNIAGRKL